MRWSLANLIRHAGAAADAAPRGGAAGGAGGESDGAPLPVVRAAEWRQVPPIARVVAAPDTTARVGDFLGSVAGRRRPAPILLPLAHARGADGPVGLLAGTLVPATPGVGIGTAGAASGSPASAADADARDRPTAPPPPSPDAGHLADEAAAATSAAVAGREPGEAPLRRLHPVPPSADEPARSLVAAPISWTPLPTLSAAGEAPAPAAGPAVGPGASRDQWSQPGPRGIHAGDAPIVTPRRREEAPTPAVPIRDASARAREAGDGAHAGQAHVRVRLDRARRAGLGAPLEAAPPGRWPDGGPIMGLPSSLEVHRPAPGTGHSPAPGAAADPTPPGTPAAGPAPGEPAGSAAADQAPAIGGEARPLPVLRPLSAALAPAAADVPPGSAVAGSRAAGGEPAAVAPTIVPAHRPSSHAREAPVLGARQDLRAARGAVEPGPAAEPRAVVAAGSPPGRPIPPGAASVAAGSAPAARSTAEPTATGPGSTTGRAVSREAAGAPDRRGLGTSMFQAADTGPDEPSLAGLPDHGAGFAPAARTFPGREGGLLSARSAPAVIAPAAPSRSVQRRAASVLSPGAAADLPVRAAPPIPAAHADTVARAPRNAAPASRDGTVSLASAASPVSAGSSGAASPGASAPRPPVSLQRAVAIEDITSSSAEGAGAAAGGSPESLDEHQVEVLAQRLYGRIRRRLEADLRLDRERAGMLADLG